MIKNSAIVGASLFALPDLLKEARIVNSNTFQTSEAFFWAAVGYMLLTVTATVVFRGARERGTPSAADQLRLRARQLGVECHRELTRGSSSRVPRESRDRADRDDARPRPRPRARAARRFNRRPVRRAAKGWIDIFRNLPLIFLILYLALTLPESGARTSGPTTRRASCPKRCGRGLVLAGIGGLVALQLGRAGGDHASRHPVARARPARGRCRAGAEATASRRLRDPARRACGAWSRRRSRS